MVKRIPALIAKPGEVRAGWARPERSEPPELCVAWGGAGADRSDARIVLKALQGCDVYKDRDLVTELESRGYDITTMKFSIRRRAEN